MSKNELSLPLKGNGVFVLLKIEVVLCFLSEGLRDDGLNETKGAGVQGLSTGVRDLDGCLSSAGSIFNLRLRSVWAKC